VELWLRKLIRKRSQGRLRWKGFSPRREPSMEKSKEEEQIDRFVEHSDALSPDEQTALREEVRNKVDAETADWDREQGAGG